MEKNYKDSSVFDYEAYLAMVNHIHDVLGNADSTETDKADANDEADLLSTGIAAFTNYVKTVDDVENHIKLVYARYDGEQVRVMVETADRQRRSAHEAAIASVTILNRMARMNNGNPIFTGDTKDRLAVADFCLDVTNQLFLSRVK